MYELSILKKVLIQSINKHGDQPLTLQHLVNIISLIEKRDDEQEADLQNAYNEVFEDMHKYGTD